MHQVGNQPSLRLISRVAVSAFQENDLPSSPQVNVHAHLNNLRLKNSRIVATFKEHAEFLHIQLLQHVGNCLRSYRASHAKRQ
jgi:hypothetical protein